MNVTITHILPEYRPQSKQDYPVRMTNPTGRGIFTLEEARDLWHQLHKAIHQAEKENE
jgi:hypothetical protein